MIVRVIIAAVVAVTMAGGVLYLNTAHTPAVATESPVPTTTRAPAKVAPQAKTVPVPRAPQTSPAESVAIGNIKIRP